MKAQWDQLALRFAAISQRERLMLAGATLLAIGFVLNLLWLSPALGQRATAHKVLAQKSAEAQTLRAQIAQLKQQADLERVQGEATLKSLQQDYRVVSDALGELGRNLIAAREMPAFLRNVMPRTRGVEIVAVRTLSVAPLLPVAENANDGGAQAAADAADPGNLYRHSVEIKLAGRYSDLYDWLLALERAPKKVLWGDLTLEVQKYPVNVLTLTVHTLSLDRAWLSI
ncbi:MAG TPA: hypothetical protein VIS73_11325 [Rhodocyclaceae bacterium]